MESHIPSVAGIPHGIALPNFASNELYLIPDPYRPPPTITKIKVGIGPSGAIYAEDLANFVYVANSGSNDVSVIDLNTNHVINTVKVGTSPLGITHYPAIHNIYVANSGSNDVSIVHKDGDEYSILKTEKVGIAPSAIAFNAANKLIYVANSGSNDVSIISEYSVENTVKVGTSPSSIACSHSKIYVANSGSNDVSIIDASSNQVIKTVKVGTSPSSAVYVYNCGAICVANSGSNDISVLNDEKGEVSYTIQVEKPFSIAKIGDYMYLVGGPLNVHGIPTKLYSFTSKEIDFNYVSQFPSDTSTGIPSYLFSVLRIKDFDLIT